MLQNISHHFKASQWKISKSSSLKYSVILLQVLDNDLIVQDDGLGILDVAQGGDIEHHAAHVVGVAANLQIKLLPYLNKASLIHLKLAPLGIQGEGVKQHGADEGDAGGLAVVDPLLGVYPKAGKFGEDVNCFECL